MTLSERLKPAGWVAIATIVFGIGVLQFWKRDLRHAFVTPAIAFGVASAFVTATNTIWDKLAVQSMVPVTYFGAYTVLVGISYVPFLRPGTSKHVWNNQWRDIVQIGFFNSGSYLLALLALQSGAASHVIPCVN